MHVTSMSERGRDWLSALEGGYRLVAYRCPAGAWTVSAGVTRYPDGSRVKEGDILAHMDEAKFLFRRVLENYEADTDALTRDDLEQHEFDALVSFVFNVGTHAASQSTLFRLVNERVDPSAQFGRWVYSNGQVLKGLVTRRKCEELAWKGLGYPTYGDVEAA